MPCGPDPLRAGPRGCVRYAPEEQGLCTNMLAEAQWDLKKVCGFAPKTAHHGGGANPLGGRWD
eukprot:5864216-Karenia_brevis.AAC.1